MSFPAFRSGGSLNRLASTTLPVAFYTVNNNPAGNSQYTDADWRLAIQRAMAAGVDFLTLDVPWKEIETSQNVYDVSRCVRAVEESAPLNLSMWLNVRVIDNVGGRAQIPAYLTGVAFDHATMLTALNNLLTAIAAVVPRVFCVSLGNEVDSYLGSNPTDIIPYATLIESAKAKTQALWGPETHVVASFQARLSATTPAAWNVYSPVHAATTIATLTYYFINPDFTIYSTDPEAMEKIIGDDLYTFLVGVGVQPYMFEEFGCPSSAVLNSSESLQQSCLHAAFTAFTAFRDLGVLRAVVWFWMSDYPDWILDIIGVTGNQREYIKTIGLRRSTDNSSKPAWTELLTWLNGFEINELWQTLDALTLSSQGTTGGVEIAGDVTQTLDAVIATSTGTVDLAGQAAITLDAVLASGAAGVEIAGSASPTLGVLTTAATATVDIAGTSALTLDALTTTSAGTLDIQGVSAPTLDALVVDSSGVVGSAPLTGDVTQTLGAVTAASTGTVDVAADVTQTLAALTVSAPSTVDVRGDVTQNLAAVTVVSTSTVDVAGVAAPTLGAVTTTSDGTVSLSGGLASTLESLSLASDGTVGAAPLLGDVTQTLAALTVSSQGAAEIAAQVAQTLGDVLAASTATAEIAGTVATALGALTTTAAGQIAIAGDGIAALADLAVVTIGAVAVQGTVTATLDPLTVVPASVWQPVARPGRDAGYTTVLVASQMTTTLAASVYTTELQDAA